MKFTNEDMESLSDLRQDKPVHQKPHGHSITWSARLADKITDIVGSWRFLIIQTLLLTLWLILNVTAYINHWDPYPFILLNLILSFQAAYTAPVIMMSQNRQVEIDRQKLEYYYKINLKEELEIKLLHHKINLLIKHLGVKEE